MDGCGVGFGSRTGAGLKPAVGGRVGDKLGRGDALVVAGALDLLAVHHDRGDRALGVHDAGVHRHSADLIAPTRS